MDRNDEFTQHSAGKSVLLHLLPGVLIGACYFVLMPIVRRHGYPTMAALMLSVALILVPVELGYLLFQGRKLNGRLSLQGVIDYRRALSPGQYIVWVPSMFIVLALIFLPMKPLDSLLQRELFAWIPTLNTGLEGSYSRDALVVTYALVAVFGVVAGPLTEEVYFRGHLLPRMKYAGRWAPLLHGFLFALYHVWTPWMLLTRTLGTLPLVWAAKRRSLHLSIAVHMAVNSVDLIAGIAFIAAMANTG